ncbi:MAG: hypothetical protein HZB76_06195 [Chlamydiae bacterium]|nr:hypothetical protein [Chlamydiota bacterium]
MASCVNSVTQKTDPSSESMFDYINVFSLIRNMMAQSLVTSMNLNNTEMNVQSTVSVDEESEMKKAAQQYDMISKYTDNWFFQNSGIMSVGFIITGIVLCSLVPVIGPVLLGIGALLMIYQQGINVGIVAPAKMQIAGLTEMAQIDTASVESVGAQTQEISSDITNNLQTLSNISSQTMKTLGNTCQVLKSLFNS